MAQTRLTFQHSLLHEHTYKYYTALTLSFEFDNAVFAVWKGPLFLLKNKKEICMEHKLGRLLFNPKLHTPYNRSECNMYLLAVDSSDESDRRSFLSEQNFVKVYEVCQVPTFSLGSTAFQQAFCIGMKF